MSFLFLSEGVEFGSLWAPELSTEQIFFLIINIQKIGAKVRAVELTGKKSFHPSRILVIAHSRMAQGTPKIYSSRAQRAFIDAFRLKKENVPLLFCAGSNRAALEHNVTKGPFLVRANTKIHQERAPEHLV